MLDLLQTLEVTAVSLICYNIVLVIYRLYFHPLSKFPGPKLAAATSWVEIYYDVVKSGGGVYIWEIEKMHKQYGPIVRISPSQLHINDPAFYDEIYAGSHKKRDKPLRFSPGVLESSVFATADHDLHRSRRAALNPFFAKRSITRFEAHISEKVSTLCTRFSEELRNLRVVHLNTVFTALTVDIITDYSYGKSWDFLTQDDYNSAWREAFNKPLETVALWRNFPFIPMTLRSLPESWLVKLDPSMEAILLRDREVLRDILKILNHDDEKEDGRRSVFTELRDNPDLPKEERSPQRLADEGGVLLGAGSEATAQALSITTYYILTTPGVLQRLRGELKSVMPRNTDIPKWTDLEKLPYLTAVIHEGLRFAHGASSRLPRLAYEPLKYGDWVIPPRTPISQATYFVHFNPELFPSPHEFKPERWLQNGGERRLGLERYLVSFNKGTRQCLGINLAYAEIYLAVAGVFRRFDFKLFETTSEDVKFVRDLFVPSVKVGSKGVRVLVTGEVD